MIAKEPRGNKNFDISRPIWLLAVNKSPAISLSPRTSQLAALLNASRSKKISIIKDLEKSKIIERSLDENDKRKKTIKIRDEIKNKLNKFLD